MRSNPTLWLVPMASLLFSAAMVAGACSSSSGGTTVTPSESDPGGQTAQDITFGSPCRGDVFVPAGIGYAVCEKDRWGYTTDDPSVDGYAQLPELPNDAGPDFDADTNVDANGQANTQGPQGACCTSDMQ